MIKEKPLNYITFRMLIETYDDYFHRIWDTLAEEGFDLTETQIAEDLGVLFDEIIINNFFEQECDFINEWFFENKDSYTIEEVWNRVKNGLQQN